MSILVSPKKGSPFMPKRGSVAVGVVGRVASKSLPCPLPAPLTSMLSRLSSSSADEYPHRSSPDEYCSASRSEIATELRRLDILEPRLDVWREGGAGALLDENRLARLSNTPFDCDGDSGDGWRRERRFVRERDRPMLSLSSAASLRAPVSLKTSLASPSALSLRCLEPDRWLSPLCWWFKLLLEPTSLLRRRPQGRS